MTAPDFADVRGLSPEMAHAIVRAVSEHEHHARVVLALDGPPGTGKTMVARRLTGLLPDLTDRERYSLEAEREGAGLPARPAERPFRAPHHTISERALVGEGWSDRRAESQACVLCRSAQEKGRALDPHHRGHTLPRGVVGRAGEVALARHGVLFLDELAEFSALAVRSLARAWRDTAATNRPLLVTATTPCPCGWQGSDVRECTCKPHTVAYHRERVEIALAAFQAEVVRATLLPVTLASLREGPPGPSTAELRERVEAAP